MTTAKLLLDDIYRWESETPNATWMTQPTGGGQVTTYTWAQAMDQARRMATHLRSLELEPGSRIAIISKNCAHFVFADIAIWLAGHVSVAIYPTLNADTISYILEHSEAKLAFVGKLDALGEVAKGVPEGLPTIAFPLAPETSYQPWDEVVAAHEPLEGQPSREADEMALIIYTSGSTGRPKGVMHSFGGIAAAVGGCESLFKTSRADRMLSYLPLAHVFERAVVEIHSFRSGMQLFFAESLLTFVADLNRAQPTLFVSVPRLWLKFQLGVFQKMPPEKLQRLLKIPVLGRIVRKKVLKGLGLDKVRMAISGSAPIPAELIVWYRSLGLELLEGYGMSEDFAYSHVSFPGRGRPGYVGEAMPGVEVKISDDEENLGEILIKSPARMMGYYKQEELTDSCFTSNGFFRTGDRGEQDEIKRLKITGRVKEIFKTSKGKYVAPAPIENLLNGDALIELSCVSGSGHPQPYAALVLSEAKRDALSKGEISQADLEPALEALLSRVNSELESFEKLQYLMVAKTPWAIESGHLTPTMKLKRSAIEADYNPQLETWYGAAKKVVWEG